MILSIQRCNSFFASLTPIDKCWSVFMCTSNTECQQLVCALVTYTDFQTLVCVRILTRRSSVGLSSCVSYTD